MRKKAAGEPGEWFFLRPVDVDLGKLRERYFVIELAEAVYFFCIAGSLIEETIKSRRSIIIFWKSQIVCSNRYFSILEVIT